MTRLGLSDWRTADWWEQKLKKRSHNRTTNWKTICLWKYNYCTYTLEGHYLWVIWFLLHAYCRQVAQACCIRSVVTMILSIHSSLGYFPQFYQQNPSQFLPGPTPPLAYPHPGYIPSGCQYPPQQSYYYGQPAPAQLPPAGNLYHASIPPQQHTPDPQMQGPSYQGNFILLFSKPSSHF